MLIRVNCFLIACLCGIGPAVAEQDDLAPLRQEIAEVRSQYGQWSVTITRKIWENQQADFRLADIDELDDQRTPQTRKIQKIVVSGDRFRQETIEPQSDREILLFDGQLARCRNTFESYNGPFKAVAQSSFLGVLSDLPHTTQTNSYSAPDLTWLFGPQLYHPWVDDLTLPNDWNGIDETEAIEEKRAFGETPTVVNVASVHALGHPCWHVQWEESDGECEVWLAKDRSLLPIRLRQVSSIETVESKIVGFQKSTSEDDAIWLPKRIVETELSYGTATVACVDFEPLPLPTSDRVFSSEPWFRPTGSAAPTTGMSPQFTIAPTAGTEPSMLAGPNGGLIKILAVAGIVTGLVFLFAGLAWLLTVQTRIGRWFRPMVERRRRIVSVMGALWMTAIYLFAWSMPGWREHGIALLLAGLSGVLWFVLVTILSGRRTFSIGSALWMAFCVALVFAGYSGGLKKSQTRQAMADQIRSAGGKVELHQWDDDNAPFFIPSVLVDFFGDAFGGSVARVLIPQRMFTAANVRSWCMDEVSFIWIAPEIDEPYSVNADAIAAIDGKQQLTTFWVTGGVLDANALAELSQFPNLTHLHSNCDGKPLPHEIHELDQLQILAFEDAVINDALLDTVSKLSNLESLAFPDVRSVGPIDQVISLDIVHGINIYSSEITPQSLESLGSIREDLHLIDCNLVWLETEGIHLPQSTSFAVYTDGMTNRWLSRLQVSTNMKSIYLRTSKITPAAFEAFSKRHPHVCIGIRL